MMVRFGALLASISLPAFALAQSTSPAQMGITHTTSPEILKTLDRTQTWVPIGQVDPVSHIWIPVLGGGYGCNSLDYSPPCNSQYVALGGFL